MYTRLMTQKREGPQRVRDRYEQRRLSGENEDDTRNHRIANIAIGPPNDETPGRIPRRKRAASIVRESTKRRDEQHQSDSEHHEAGELKCQHACGGAECWRRRRSVAQSTSAPGR